MKIGVLVSGSGSNLQACLDAVGAGVINGSVCVVIADRPGCYALERAAKSGVDGLTIDRNGKSEDELSDAILAELKSRKVSLVVLAGFLSILNERFIENFQNAVINIHPALIPSFCGKGQYGLRVHQSALNYGVKLSGATVHFVDEGTDTGPIIMQKSVEVLPEDTPETLQKRVLTVEHELLPKAVAAFCDGLIEVDGRAVTVKTGGN